MKLHWYDGGMLPERPAELEENRELDPEDGIIFVGDKGKMLVGGWGGEHPRLLPESRDKEYKRPPKTLPRSIGHHKEWIEAIKGNGATLCNFAYSGALAETVLLGNVAFRSGKAVTWDDKAGTVDSPEAAAYLQREYRKGWKL